MDAIFSESRFQSVTGITGKCTDTRNVRWYRAAAIRHHALRLVVIRMRSDSARSSRRAATADKGA
jgi:hypothetical protein